MNCSPPRRVAGYCESTEASHGGWAEHKVRGSVQGPLHYKWERLPNSGGIGPVRSFLRRTRDLSTARLPNSGGIEPVKPVPARLRRFQSGKVAQFRRDWTGQFVLVEVQPFQVGKVAYFRRDWTRKVVAVGNTATDQRAFERQRYDSARNCSPYPVPFFQRPVSQPVVIFTPVGAAGGMIESNQGLPVGF